MKSNFQASAMLIILTLIFSGCVFTRQKINIENFHSKAEQVEAGKTKARELAAILGGPPNAILPMEEGKEVYVYTFGDGKTKGLNLIIFGVTKTNLGLDSAYFFINENKVVEEKIVSTNSKDVPWEWWAFGD